LTAPTAEVITGPSNVQASHDSAATLYDQIPYVSHPYPRGHVDRLATMAILMGMSPRPIESSRVLEIGCAAGGHLIPMAMTIPGSEFIGIDLSSRELAEGQATVSQLGLKNIQLLHKGIEAVGDTLGQFDYIICHGVFSWVPGHVREHILNTCRDCLSPQGVAYISYNTYPGWHFRNVVRDMMLYHARKQTDALARAREGRQLLEFLTKNVPAEKSAYGAALRDESAIVSRVADWYLCHDHIAQVNDPFYFHQFAALARGKNLQYLGEADFRSMLPRGASTEVLTTLRQFADDIISEQQYLDFMQGTPFRHSLLCHDAVKLNRRPGIDCLEKLHVTIHLKPPAAPIDPLSPEPVTFSGPGGSLTTNRPLMKAAVLHLLERAPLSAAFPDLFAAASARVNPSPLRPSEEIRADREALAAILLKGYYTSDLLQFHASPVIFCTAPTERPLATPLARLQAARQKHVTNLRHDTTDLSVLQRLVLRHLDGQHDRPALLELLNNAAREGTLVLQPQAEPTPAKSAAALEQALETTLTELARRALLMA
jgi:methyltransferase-like protein/2-polyprenyl-3-methyl-5-hydroxy-6-metoxy-1,4-benzoquinol methylase